MINQHCKVKHLSSPARFSFWKPTMTLILAAGILTFAGIAQATDGKSPTNASSCPTLLDHKFPRLQDEKMLSMCQFQGQVLLVVNTASFCGFTSQYEELEKLQAQFKTKGFNVVGFPSSDFGNQEYKSNKEIAAFCNNTFGVQFPMFAKTTVKGDSANPLYKQLAKATGEQPGWNFHKYLIDRKGQVVGTFKSGVSPTSPEIKQAIRRALDAHPITKQ
ncbi:glutathione peroxidase [Limnobacter parvus]|uniref:Glutathione peroxidase n=1 Tax=Limnobacter parvus TaxID=2939690 RepID=A0ABT1XEQ3_9BURK|nr:glutathione peroxidase [Limnobacter parvus]MCR2745619.1 glutathione peroxidase [Limnobacter parvus]